jgi:hypothetical protein
MKITAIAADLQQTLPALSQPMDRLWRAQPDVPTLAATISTSQMCDAVNASPGIKF